ncbi:MAG: hypothetical protein IT497_01510 [Ottowia sp.]|nr:hypothetical protein [Ottowia sp.]
MPRVNLPSPINHIGVNNPIHNKNVGLATPIHGQHRAKMHGNPARRGGHHDVFAEKTGHAAIQAKPIDPKKIAIYKVAFSQGALLDKERKGTLSSLAQETHGMCMALSAQWLKRIKKSSGLVSTEARIKAMAEKSNVRQAMAYQKDAYKDKHLAQAVEARFYAESDKLKKIMQAQKETERAIERAKRNPNSQADIAALWKEKVQRHILAQEQYERVNLVSAQFNAVDPVRKVFALNNLKLVSEERCRTSKLAGTFLNDLVNNLKENEAALYNIHFQNAKKDQTSAHSMALSLNAKKEVHFFDSNYGEYRVARADFVSFINAHMDKHYSMPTRQSFRVVTQTTSTPHTITPTKLPH